MSWFDKLTLEELEHLKTVAGCTTLAAFRKTAAYQKQWREIDAARGVSNEPCYDCKAIARKLGLPV